MKEKLLCLHGALGSKKQLNALKEKLEANYEVYTMNFEGHGGTESDRDFSIQLFSQNLIDFLRNQSIDALTIFGYSMGGYVALNTALIAPERIKKVITLGTKFNWDPEAAERETKLLNPLKIEEKVPHFAKQLKEEHHPQDWKELMKKTAKMMIGMAEGAKLNDEDFKKIEQRVVIGIGNQDNMVSLEESQHIAALLPNSTLIQLEGVPHPIDKVDLTTLVNYIQSNY